jgi:hypothetical protein
LSGALKVASFTVHAAVEQSARWKQAAEAEGHRSAGTWLAAAADAYLKARARAGAPIPLAWHHGAFRVLLEDGSTPTLRGMVSSPFGIFRGTAAGPVRGGRSYALVYIPDARIVASLHHAAQCKSLAAELAGPLLRGMPAPDSGGIVERYRREDA